MMVKHWLILFLLFFIFGIANSQTNVNVFLSPASVMNPNLKPALQPGIEFIFQKKYGVLTEVAIPFLSNVDSNEINCKGLRTRIEFRYHFNKNNPFYLALNFSYSSREFDKYKGGDFNKITEPDSIHYQYKSAHINSPFFTTALQVGLIGKLYKRLFIETFAGLGVRVVNTDYSKLVDLEKIDYSSAPKCGFVIPRYWETEGKLVGVQINFGCRFFYKLNSK